MTDSTFPAALLSTNSRSHRSDWAVRCLVIAAALLVTVAVTVSRWSVEQSSRATTSASDALTSASTVAERHEAAINRKLDETVSVDLHDVPLEQAVRTLAQSCSIPVEFRFDAIRDDELSVSIPVTLQVPAITLRSALRLLLGPNSLTYLVADEVLQIIPSARAADILELQVYDVTDLVHVIDTKAPGRPNFTSLMNSISVSVLPDTWENLSGQGSISPLSLGARRVLSIRQTQAAHSQVRRLLADVRQACKAHAAGAPTPIVVKSDRSEAALREEAIRQSLDRSVDVDIREQPLHQALALIAREAGVPCVIDRAKLTEEGIEIEHPVTLQQPQISIRSALKLLLEPMQLSWIIQNEVLQVSTSATAADALEVQVYDVSDVAPSYRTETGKVSYDLTSLSNAISTSIQPDSWEEGGFSPGIFRFDNGALMAIRHTQSVHEELAGFFSEIRNVRLGQPAEDRVAPPVPRQVGTGFRSSWARIDPRRDALVRGNNQFALELYAKLARSTKGNLLISPYCISGAVALAYAGARGQTAIEISQTMHYVVRQQDVADAFRSLQPVAFLWGPDARFTVTNQFWGQQGISYDPAFQKTLNDCYRTGVLPLDFADPGQAAQAINDWTVARTGGSILRLANPGDFTPGASFIVASAVHFDGKWSRPFNPEATKLAPFASPSGPIDVALMHEPADKCRFAAVDGIQVLGKTYGNGDVSMVILLPADSPTGLTDLEAALDENSLARWLAAEDSLSAELFLPRLKLDAAFNLRRELESLGMRSAFDEHLADFRGISEMQPLALSGVIHKAFVQIDEQGPRPAPGMGHVAAVPAAVDSAAPIFRADRPFLFLIRDSQSGSLLFIGRVVNPDPT